MSIYIVKITNEENVENARKLQEFTHDGIYNFENEIQENDPVFIYFGGDSAQVSWETGLAGVGKIIKGPYEKGYDKEKKRNFKIDVKTIHVLDKPIPPKASKIHKTLSEALYDVPYIGANHFPNQAIAKISTEAGVWAAGSLYKEWAPLAEKTLASLGLLSIPKIKNVDKGADLVPPTKTDIIDIVFGFHAAAVSANIKIDKRTAERLISSLLAKRFLILTGLSGSGKTKIAHALVAWLTKPVAQPYDPFTPKSEIKSDRISYFVDSSDSISVIFLNKSDTEGAIKVALPRDLIAEWVVAIDNNNFTRETPARTIREMVAETTKYSPQQNSFETNLKAASFAVIEARHKDASTDSAYRIIPVGADWTNREPLFGYPDALVPGDYRLPSAGALQLIQRAVSDPKRPYFLILDEMNLSHVERYFADVLSAMESGLPIPLHEQRNYEASSWGGIPHEISLPPNLFVIGTVNIDETTYMFSPKVLDRANVIEFIVAKGDISAFLEKPEAVNIASIEGKGSAFAEIFVAQASNSAFTLEELGSVNGVPMAPTVKKALEDIFDVLATAGAEFGYRPAYEISRFIYCYAKVSKSDWKLDDAIDAAIMQKLLPKLHGSKTKLSPVIEKLKKICEDRYPISSEKLTRMEQRLRQNGFTSYAEA